MNAIPRRYCEGCNLHIAPFAPDKFVHKNKFWHIDCFKKYNSPLRIEEIPTQLELPLQKER